MRILVLRGGALGDFLVTLPALRALRSRWPDAEIVLIGNARAAQLGVLSGEISRVFSQHDARWSAFYSDPPLSTELRSWLDQFDWVLSFWADPGGSLASNFSFLGNRFLKGNAEVKTAPAARHFCAALAPLKLLVTDFRSQLNLPAQVCREAHEKLTKLDDFWAIHPGSGSARKNWPLARWEKLCEQLGAPLLIISGEADLDPIISLRWRPSKPIVYAREWPLPTLAAALQRARGFVGHDTGIGHLAAAVGTPSLLLFGPTDPAIWAPPGEHVQTVREGEELENISVETVVAQVRRLGQRAALS